MKLRFLPVMISLVVSSAVLFGGWFVYRSVAVESPLTRAVNHIDGVEHADINLTSDSAKITLKLQKQADLRKIVDDIRREGAKEIGGRTLKIEVADQPSPTLDKWWSGALFDVAQAMENRQYGQIPPLLDKLEAAHKGLLATAEMDDDNVYIHFQYGKESKYEILPRIPETIGVWPNE